MLISPNNATKIGCKISIEYTVRPLTTGEHTVKSGLKKWAEEQVAPFHNNLGVVKRMLWTLRLIRVAIYPFIILWIVSAIVISGVAIHEMFSSSQPLVINGVRSTWAVSVGFVGLILVMGICGAACLLWTLRLLRKDIALEEARKKEIEGRGHVA